MKFRRRSIVEAYRFSGDPKSPGWPENWLQGVKYSEDGKTVYVQTHKGEIFVNKGGWIVQDDNGGTYFCRAGVFEKMFEPLEAGNGKRVSSMFGTEIEDAAREVHDLFYAYCAQEFCKGLKRNEGEDPKIDKVVNALTRLHDLLNRDRNPKASVGVNGVGTVTGADTNVSKGE